MIDNLARAERFFHENWNNPEKLEALAAELDAATEEIASLLREAAEMWDVLPSSRWKESAPISDWEAWRERVREVLRKETPNAE